MANSIGTAWIQIKPSMKGISAGISKELGAATEKAANNAAGKMKNVFSNAAESAKKAALVAGGAVAGVVGLSVKNFAEFEQLAGGMQKIFGENMWGKIKKDADAAWSNMNLSATNYMRTITGVGSTFAKSMGSGKGYEMAKKGMQAIADYASGTGKNVDLLAEKFQMISRSSAGYMSIADQFAGILPQTTDDFLKQAQQAGILSEKYTTLTQVPVAEYQEAISKMIEKGVSDMGLLGNTADETSGTLSGSFNGMKSAWENFSTALGSGDEGEIKAKFDDLSLAVGNFANNVLPVAGNVISSLFQTLWENYPVLTVIGVALGGLAAAVLAINTAMSIWNGIVKVASVVQTVWNLAMAANPLVLLVPALAAVIGAIALFITKTELGQKIWEGFTTFLGGAAQSIVGFFTGAWNTITGIFGGLAGFFTRIWNSVVGIFRSVGTKIGNAIGGAFKSVINGVISAVEGIINTPINAINGVLDVVNKVPGISIGKIPTVSFGRMATGGPIVGAGTGTSDSIPIMASNGEFILRAAAAKNIGIQALNYMNKTGQIPAKGAMSQNIVINVNGYEKDPQVLAQEISRIIALNRGRVLA